MPIPDNQLRSWSRQAGGATYHCSTDPKAIQLDVLSAALESDMLWWAKPLSEEALKRLVENSFCFGLYAEEADDGGKGASDGNGTKKPMIGFARLATDFVTFGYLTDVYVTKEHQGKGLGRWAMECINEALDTWPDLRRCLIIPGDPNSARLYQTTMGARHLRDAPGGEVPMMEKQGRAYPEHKHT